MGLFNHNGNVPVDVLAHDVTLYSAKSAVLFGNAIHDASKYPPRPDYLHRKLFQLEKGVHGLQKRVLGERLGVIDYGNTGEDLQSPAAIVTVTVRVIGKLALQSEKVAVRFEDIASDAQTLEPNEFCTQAIARAVLMTANGAENK